MTFKFIVLLKVQVLCIEGYFSANDKSAVLNFKLHDKEGHAFI